MANGLNGVYYYKLQEGKYGNDLTKGCSLSCCELDHNFNFLRGMDIKGMEWNPETGDMCLVRLNEERIPIKVEPIEIGEYKFVYDSDKGQLIITPPAGEDIILEGFSTPNDVALSTTDKIIGDGTLLNPLDMESAYMTGTYRPVERLLDLTTDEALPEDPAMHDRYVTKENINEAGYFYTYEEVKKIQEYLNPKTKEESDDIWRVPRIEDWDKLLNKNEPCPGGEGYIEHGEKDKCNELQGKFAGKMCKSKKFWREWPEEEGTDGTRNELKMNILPLGSQRDQFTNALNSLGTIAKFWSISPETPEDKNDIQGKQFEFNTNKVRHFNPDPNVRITLRLVKNYNGRNYKEFEFIKGIPVKTILDNKSGLIWTETNVSIPIDTEEFKRANSEFTEQIISELCNGEEDNLTKNTYYFVNQWNGDYWHKIPMQEGESVVLFEAQDAETNEPVNMHEWRLVNGELVDTADILRNDMNEDFQEIKDRITVLEGRMNNASLRLGNLESKMTSAEENIGILQEGLTKAEKDIAGIKKDLAEVNTDLSEVEKKLNEIEGKIGKLEDLIEDFNTRIEDLEKKVEENKVENKDGSILVEYGEASTNIKVNLPADIEGELPNHIKVDNDTEGEKRLYFDGFFGTF